MRINSISANYSSNYAKRGHVNKQQNLNFGKHYSCAKFWGVSMTGIGISGTMGVAEFFNNASSASAIALASVLGVLMGIQGYCAGKKLDKTITDGMRFNEQLKKHLHPTDET